MPVKSIKPAEMMIKVIIESTLSYLAIGNELYSVLHQAFGDEFVLFKVENNIFYITFKISSYYDFVTWNNVIAETIHNYEKQVERDADIFTTT